MKIVVVSEIKALNLMSTFRKFHQELKKFDIEVVSEVGIIKKKNYLKIVKRQAKINKTNFFIQFISIIVFSLLKKIYDKSSNSEIKKIDNITHINGINSNSFVEHINYINPDYICLMGTGIVSQNTLNRLKKYIFLNIHSSDPNIFRGQPPFFWEIFHDYDSYSLTIHDVVKDLDAGRILNQKSFKIPNKKNIFQILNFIEKKSLIEICKLYKNTLIKLNLGNIKYVNNKIGELKTIPRIDIIIRALLINYDK